MYVCMYTCVSVHVFVYVCMYVSVLQQLKLKMNRCTYGGVWYLT